MALRDRGLGVYFVKERAKGANDLVCSGERFHVGEITSQVL